MWLWQGVVWVRLWLSVEPFHRGAGGGHGAHLPYGVVPKKCATLAAGTCLDPIVSAIDASTTLVHVPPLHPLRTWSLGRSKIACRGRGGCTLWLGEVGACLRLTPAMLSTE